MNVCIYSAPLFSGRHKCTCGKQAACCGGSESDESDIGSTKLINAAEKVAEVEADEVISVVDEPEVVEEIFQDSNVNDSVSGETGDSGEPGDSAETGDSIEE